LLLLLFLLRHLFLVLLFDPLQLVRNDGTNTPRIVIVNLGRRTTELFFPFVLAIPSVPTMTRALRDRDLLNKLPE
jgi:hypothetical protein